VNGTFPLGLVVGAAVAVAVVWLLRRREADETASYLPLWLEHVISLLRRAHKARLACLVRGEGDPVVAQGEPRLPPAEVDRALAVTRLAMTDGRQQVIRDDGAGWVAAAGDGRLGVGLVFGETGGGADDPSGVVAELRQLLAEIRLELTSGPRDARPSREVFSPSMDTLSGVASGLCERARTLAGRASAVVIRDPTTLTASVIAQSTGTDRRLLGMPVTPDSVVGRACMTEQPVAGRSSLDLFGHPEPDRRQRDEQGMAFPLRDGSEGLGALVVFGPVETLAEDVMERLVHLCVDTAGQLAAARAVKVAETRALTDPLTGLPNRSALQRAMAGAGEGALLAVDIDHFKQLNDTHGHAAGDAALRHMAAIFRRVLRDEDVPARVGGEEFALWLPGTRHHTAMEVAERVRAAVAETPWEWANVPVALRCSIGVASTPETSSVTANLLAAADAALYRAKEGGRNRVEPAVPSAVPPNRATD